MALTGRYCRWCDLKELRPDNIQEFNEWLAQPKGCCAPDGDGHLFVFPYGYSWQNPPNKACTPTLLESAGLEALSTPEHSATSQTDQTPPTSG
jgi:hypothetical protein